MALSELATRLYEELGDRLANPGALIKRLEVGQAVFESATDDLVNAGLVCRDGSRLRRVIVTTAVGLSPVALQMLAKLPTDGTSIGGLRLRSLVDLNNEEYRTALHELKQLGAVRLGPGRGGTIARVDLDDQIPASEASVIVDSSRRGVRKESELYGPFVAWLLSSLESQDFSFAHAKVTATPDGRRRASGQWSRPDVTAVEVWRSEWLPDIEVTISSFEIKRSVDVARLESVYEAKAHGRWAHRSSLVVEVLSELEEEVPEETLDELQRFDLGLYSMIRKSDGSFRIQQHVAPGFQSPEPSLVSELLQHYFKTDRKLAESYRGAIR